MKPIFQFIREQLQDFYPETEIKSFIYLILESVCNMDKSSVLQHKDKQLSLHERLRIEEIIMELKKHLPIQYILGETEFYGLKYKVDENVLIPRPETEELVERVLKQCTGLRVKGEGCRVLDIGTGSGCIAVVLAKYLPDAKVYALDISEKALNVALQNAIKNQVEVHFFKYDILEGDSFPYPALGFDCIVSNPPYVTLKEKVNMGKNVLDYEPHQAIFVPDDNPLLFYERIADFARNRLKENGSLYLEINSLYGQVLMKMLKEKKFHSVELLKDISGKDRIIIAKL